jgi:two-component system, LytTR family, response regulator
MLRAVIVDDEPLARAALGRLCADRPQVAVIAEADNGRKAIELIERSRPDLLLLDVELGDMTGFDVLRAVRGPENPLAIMVTGHPAHAAHAFDAQAVDFVPKPIERARLHAALDRVVDRIAVAPRPRGRVRLVGERARRLHFIDAEEIDYLEVDGNYVTIHVGSDRFLTRHTLAELAGLLEPCGFLRIERALLINLGQVAFASRLERGAFEFSLKRGQRLVSSRERSGSIARLLRGVILIHPHDE